MSKNNLICLIFSVISIALVAILTTNYVIEEKNNHFFEIRTALHMSELEDINNNKLERLKLTKAVFIFTSILHLKTKTDITQYKDWCNYIDNNYDKKLITLIENRTEIPKKDLTKFLIEYKRLQNLCLLK